jgi:hypothetical protein
MTQVQKYYKSKHIYHICTYWTRMFKVIHDLYWHSSTRIEFHSVIYTKDDFITVLFYVNISLFLLCTNSILILYSDSGMCTPHMHTNETPVFFFLFFSDKSTVRMTGFFCSNQIISFSTTIMSKKTTTTIIDQSVYRMTG